MLTREKIHSGRNALVDIWSIAAMWCSGSKQLREGTWKKKKALPLV